MKFFLILLALISPLIGNAQHTFSIVAVDPVTGEIGSAGATCLSFDPGAITISDIILDVGAVHTQAFWNPDNQIAARARMEAGDSPSEIITWLVANDTPSTGGNISDRQYGIVDLNGGVPRSAAYTGTNNLVENGHRIGKGYAIQGNILISQDVLNDMETTYLNAKGSLSDKLMAVLQAAKRPGADSRCLGEGISSGSAFIRVAKPTDTDSSFGKLWLDIYVWLDSKTFTGDPIDEIQSRYNDFTLGNQEIDHTAIDIYPNPTSGFLKIKNIPYAKDHEISLYSILGEKILTIANQTEEVDLSGFDSGIYFLVLNSSKGVVYQQKIIKR